MGPLPAVRSNEMNIWVEPISKLYTDVTSCFPVHSRSGYQYIMTAYHCDSNTIIVCPFKTKKDKDRIAAYSSIIHRLSVCSHSADLQILDNEVSVEYTLIIEEKWNVSYQLMPPDVHCRNADKRAIVLSRS